MIVYGTWLGFVWESTQSAMKPGSRENNHVLVLATFTSYVEEGV
jgi:hypothetical protein